MVMLVCLAGMRSRLCVHPVVRCRCSLSSLFTVFWGCRPLMSMPDALFTAIIIVVAAVVLAAVVVRVSVPAVRPVVCRLRFVRGFAEENSVPVSVSIFVRRCVAFSIAYYRRRPSCSPLRFPSLDTPPLPPRLSSSYRPAEPRPSHRSPQPSPHLPPHPPSRRLPLVIISYFTTDINSDQAEEASPPLWHMFGLGCYGHFTPTSMFT